MKKLLFIIGLGGIGYGLYYYFKKQLDLALNFDFKFKDVKANNIDKSGVNLALLISVQNKSSFAIEVIDYDIDVVYEGTIIGNAKSVGNFTVQGDSWFDVPVNAYIQFKGSEGILDDLGISLLKTKPVKVDFVGDMNVVFGSVSKEVVFNAKDVLLTNNLAETIGVDKTVGKLNDFLEKLGIKI
jgi:LEA14-like dessication related protein